MTLTLTQTMGVNRDYVLRQRDLPDDFNRSNIYILIYERPEGTDKQPHNFTNSISN